MKERYIRQIMLEEVGEEGQEKLKNGKVLVVGAGGLGSPVLTYLACAGVGYIRVIDYDHVSESNLNRQFLYGSNDIGKNKAKTAKEYLSIKNPEITIEAIEEKITEENVNRFLEEMDIVVDCVDNVKTRLIMNKACMKKDIPLIEGGVEGFYGFATMITRNSPCLECMGYNDNKTNRVSPVIGVTAGIIGLFEANECIRWLLGLETDLLGKYLQYNGEKLTIKKINVKINPECEIHKQYKD